MVAGINLSGELIAAAADITCGRTAEKLIACLQPSTIINNTGEDS